MNSFSTASFFVEPVPAGKNSVSLNAKHQADIQARGLLNDWARSSSKTVTAEEATFHLGYTAKSGGILFVGQNGQVQFLPDKAWKNDGEKKAPKYRSPLGEFDAFLPPSPDNPLYWEIEHLKRQAFYINDHPYILITEGIFKAIAGCSNGIPTISLLGVEQGLTGQAHDVEGKRFLVDALRIFVEAGFGFIIAFDADAATNPNVREAQKKLAKQLAKFKVPVRIITGTWAAASVTEGGEVKNTKGMDDFIQHKGIEEFRAILSKAKLFEEVDSTDEGEGGAKQKKEYPPASSTAREIAENYRAKLAWESEYQLWRQYAAEYDGCWDVATEESVRELIHCHIESLGLGYNAGYVSSVLTILKSKLEVKKWNEQKGLIPLRDGVLNATTQEFSEHAPGYRFTYQLPYKWEGRAIGCAPIEEFLVKISGGLEIAEVLLAYLAAIVTGRADLQRYLELIGGGGTGKSTFMAVAAALIGEENSVASQLKLLENNQFETAKFYRKRLGLFPDSERWQGEVSILKQLTGQDPIRYERKGVQQCKDFRFEGMIILSANEAPESSDRTSGQERRKLTIGLENKLSEYEGRDLKKEFEPYLPGLLKRVLDISAERVFQLIKHTERYVPALAAKKFQQLTETNPIAAWLDERVVVGENFKSQIGTGNPEFVGQWLYANFCQYQSEMGHKGSVPMKRFSNNLRDLLKNQLKISITEGREASGNYIYGIGLRCLVDPNNKLPRSVIGTQFCAGFEEKNAGSLSSESTGSAGFAGYDGFFENSQKSENLDLQLELSLQNVEKKLEGVKDVGKNPTNPTNPALPRVPASPNPTRHPTQASTGLNESENELVGFIRAATDSETAKQIQNILKEVCGSGVAAKEKIWGELSVSEQATFKALLMPKPGFNVGDRVKITPDYPRGGTQTLIGVEGTVREDLGKRGLDIEFDAEVEIVGGKPKKSLVISTEFLALIPAAPVSTKKAPTKFKVGDRVAIKDVGGRCAGTKGTVSKVLAEDKYYIDYDKAVGSSKFGLWPASELWKLPN
jgi:putative DNA primase/helicase